MCSCHSWRKPKKCNDVNMLKNTEKPSIAKEKIYYEDPGRMSCATPCAMIHNTATQHCCATKPQQTSKNPNQTSALVAQFPCTVFSNLQAKTTPKKMKKLNQE